MILLACYYSAHPTGKTRQKAGLHGCCTVAAQPRALSRSPTIATQPGRSPAAPPPVMFTDNNNNQVLLPTPPGNFVHSPVRLLFWRWGRRPAAQPGASGKLLGDFCKRSSSPLCGEPRKLPGRQNRRLLSAALRVSHVVPVEGRWFTEMLLAAKC
jgi:hypothetical protein